MENRVQRAWHRDTWLRDKKGNRLAKQADTLDWIGYDHTNTSSSLNLLDLANQSDGEQLPRPFAKILGYLDVGSLYSLSTVSKRSKTIGGQICQVEIG